jgi:hypothetical protein
VARQRSVRNGLLVWAALLFLYVSLISATTWIELVVGAAVAAGAAVLGGLAVRFLNVHLALPRLRWRWLWTFPYDAAFDVARLTGRMFGLARTQRERRGWWDDVELPEDLGDPQSTRAYAVLIVSLTPASYVADVDVPDEEDVGTLRVRRWARKGPVERVVAP